MATTSVEKALEILKAFTSSDYELGNLDLSKRLGYPTSTVNRLLHILESTGFLEKNAVNKKYLLGQASADIGQAVKQRFSVNLVNIGQPHVDHLRDLIGETVGFEVMYGKTTTLIYEATGPNPVRVGFTVGDRLPIHVGAGSKAILAHLPPDKANRLLDGELASYSENTITSHDELKKQLSTIRKQGIAFDMGEYSPEVSAIGAPIFNHGKRPIAAVVVVVPTFRLTEDVIEKMIPQVKDTAEQISSKLFYSNDEP